MESGNFKDICQPVVRYCVSSDHAYQNSIELFIPIVHALRNKLAVSRNILTKWQPPIWLRYRKAGVLHLAVISLTVGRQAWFLYQINCCFTLDNTTTLQIQCFLLFKCILLLSSNKGPLHVTLFYLNSQTRMTPYCGSSVRYGGIKSWKLVWIHEVHALRLALAIQHTFDQNNSTSKQKATIVLRWDKVMKLSLNSWNTTVG